MPEPTNQFFPRSSKEISPEQRQRLLAEANAPYKVLRKFIYIAFGLSGVLGGLIFLAKLAGGDTSTQNLSNIAVQAGIIGLMALFWKWDSKKS
ncbi:MAG: DUF3493 domain-containing protein [Synechococcaceae cyanobacterium RL_1_2]|nr:DUF3493 domain-containing protein [Synechococcaceae cyanobacterium RL_1_2]